MDFTIEDELQEEMLLILNQAHVGLWECTTEQVDTTTCNVHRLVPLPLAPNRRIATELPVGLIVSEPCLCDYSGRLGIILDIPTESWLVNHSMQFLKATTGTCFAALTLKWLSKARRREAGPCVDVRRLIGQCTMREQ